MKQLSVVLHFYICSFVYALFSTKELELYSVFMKPYGISFADDLIMKVTRNFGKCAAFNETFGDCNSILVNLTSSTTEYEFSKLKSLSKSCPSGSYSCVYNAVKSDSLLKGWFVRVQSTVKNLCKEQCWQTLEKLINKCVQSGQSAIKVSYKETENAWTMVQHCVQRSCSVHPRQHYFT